MTQQLADTLGDLAQRMDEAERGITVILGSGASSPEKHGTAILKSGLLEFLRTANDFAQKADRSFAKDTDDCSFEELSSIYSEMRPDTFPAFLKQRHIRPKSEMTALPPFGLEVLAHFTAHGLVANVISFNFDEDFERALDDEIGADDYEWVRSLSVFERVAEDLKANRAGPGKPMVIKPHGTISYPATIRPRPPHPSPRLRPRSPRSRCA